MCHFRLGLLMTIKQPKLQPTDRITVAKSAGMLKEDLYHVQWMLANMELSDDERIILEGAEARIKAKIKSAEKPN